MDYLLTETDFQQMLAAKSAIAFVCFDWSGQSKMSEQLIHKWEQDWLRQSDYSSVPLFRISPDETPFLVQWVNEFAQSDEEGHEGSYGSVLWLKNGKVVRFIRFAMKTGFEGLSSISKEVLGC